MLYKLAIALLAAVWTCTAIGATHASTNQGANSGAPITAKKSTKASHKTKRKAIARARKGGNQADLDPDAEVLAQMLSSDNKNPLWSGRPSQ